VSYQGDHSAVRTSTLNECISKWGAWGLYRHATTYVPSEYYPNQPLSYYLCNYTPYVTSGNLDNSATYSNTGVISVPTSFGSHQMSFSSSFSPTYSFAALDAGVTITGQSGNVCYFNYTSGNPRINVTVTNSCGSSSVYVILRRPNGARLSAYPNPVSSESEINLTSSDVTQINIDKSEINSVYLYNEDNVLVKDYTNEIISNDSKNSIKLKHTASGVYYLKVIFSDGNVETKRLKIID
jgi:hypothetical protein